MKHPAPVVLVILSFWFVAQIIGLFVIDSIEIPTVEQPSVGIIVYLLGGVLIGSGIVLIMARFKQRRLWSLWFSIAVFSLSFIAISAFIDGFFALVGAAVFVWFKLDRRLHWFVRNIPELFIYASFGAVFSPALTPAGAAILLTAISIYDVVAVRGSKHMVVLARFQMDTDRFAGFSMPRGDDRAILGGGDFAFPMIFIGSIMLSMGWWPALFVALGGVVGLLALFTLSQKGILYPAMPFVSSGLLLALIFV